MESSGISAECIFDQAIKLMDEQSYAGQSLWSDTAEYQSRAVAVLNTLLGECFPYSDTYAVTVPGQRPTVPALTALSDRVGVDDAMARTVLPYGLAGELVKNDDPALGNYFMQRYQELLHRHGRTLPAAWERTEDCYGIASGSSWARW